MFIQNRLTEHVSGIIMPIVRRTDCVKPRVVLVWMCWLRLCGDGTRAECTVYSTGRVKHHYAYRQENRLYKTACGVSLDVLAAVVWSRDTS